MYSAAECRVRVSSTSPVSVKSVSPLQSSLSRAQLPVWLSVHCWSRHNVEMLDPFQCPSRVLVRRFRLSIVYDASKTPGLCAQF